MRRYYDIDAVGDDANAVPVRIVLQDIAMPAWQSAAIVISVFASLATLWNVMYGQRRTK